MSRLIQKRGFSLGETAIVIAIVGCLIAIAVGMYNTTKFKEETIAFKQAKLESAIRTATMSIINNNKLTAQQACSASEMRDRYLGKLQNSKIAKNVEVNGEVVPALEIENYGIIAFDSAANCQKSWYATGATPALAAASPAGESSATPASGAESTTTTPSAEKSYIESPADLSKAVVIYSLTSESTETTKAPTVKISVPSNVTANGSASAAKTLSANTLAFNVNSTGITSTYSSSATTAATTTNNYNNDINVCNIGDQYSFVSGRCTSSNGEGIKVNFYQMLDESDCRRSFCPGNGYDNDNNLITSGQINLLCKLGTGTVGQCECPGNKKFWVNVYMTDNSNVSGICINDCSEFGMIEDTETTCKCPDGTDWNNDLKRCVTPGTCPYDYLKYENGNCVCKTEAELGTDYFDVCEKWINDPTSECKTLRDNWDKSTGTCICPAPFTQDNKNCLCLNPRTLTNGVCACDAQKVTLTGEEIFDATSSTCIFDCASINQIANSAKTACVSPDCGCLKTYDINVGQCVCDPSQANNTQCINPDEKFDSTSATCKTCKSDNRMYSATGNGVCVCKNKEDLVLQDNEIYDPTQEHCIYTCKDGAVANADHTECIGGCLEQYNYTTEQLECIPNPTDAQTAACLANTNMISDPSSATCAVECPSLTTSDSSHKSCGCDESKIATALQQPGNLNKIYDLNNAPTCMAACTGQTIPSADRRTCRPVDCLYETTDNITQHCIPNPTAEQANACLSGTNFIADPTSATCKAECTGLTSPLANNHLSCGCDSQKVTTALSQPGNLNKIYDLNNAPSCMAACTGQTFPNESRTACRPVDCLYETTDNISQHCIANPSNEIIQACLGGTSYVSDPTAATCKVPCTGQTIPNDERKECRPVDCLYETTDNITQHCIPNPTAAQATACLRGTNYIADPTATTCKVECNGLTSPNTNNYLICSCDSQKVQTALNQPGNLNKIYDLDNAPSCMAACTGQTFPSADRQTCRPVDCLYETTDNITQHCIPNPTAEQANACLRGTNYIADPTAATCKTECTGLTSPTVNNHLSCSCDEQKVTSALAQPGNLNKIYDMTNAPSCMMACQGQTFPTTDRTACRPVDCLYETTDNITQHCIPNPSESITQACLAGTNYISDPTAATCKAECTGLTAPNATYKSCACSEPKVTNALQQQGNLNKIYDLNNAPSCMAACTGQTFPNDSRTVCRPVDCLYETTDNITQHCKANPTDAETIACLKNTNYKSNPSAYSCKESCGTRRSPNNVYKSCVCDAEKMETLYSSSNMKFDATSATCESACPSNFTHRDPDNDAACKCPRVKPAEVTIQAGYFYDITSTILAGTYACQLECPTTNPEIPDWISIHAPLFTDNKTVYDSTEVGCLGECEGNYIATTDRLDCICGITASSCAAGTYFDAAACECKTCPVGHYCPGGGTTPIDCPCGTYGSRTGLSTPSCSGICQAGYYCPAGSTSPTAQRCTAGYICPAGSCTPQACAFPTTSVSPYIVCDKCQSEQQIRSTQPGYFSANEIYVDDLSLQCKKCKSNMVYDANGICVCPSDKPYWDGTQCTPCKTWGTLYFARQGKSNSGCTLYDHMMGKKGACFDYERKPSEEMKRVANALSNADKNRNFANAYAYMVSYKNGVASVAGVFTVRSWYYTFPEDISSADTSKAQQQNGSCSEVCGSNSECVETCNYMKGHVTQNTMFQSCSYAVNNQWLGQTFNNAADELCTGGQIVVVRNSYQCNYGVGGILRQTISPLVLDLKGNGFKYSSVDDGVIFDLNNDGFAEKTAWTAKQTQFDNAFLVLDKNKNGQVDNGGELFGDQNGAENGFMELAKYDDNGDKVINEEDKIYNELILWVDFNANAKIDYEADNTSKEIKTLKEAGITELSTEYEIKKDSSGNILKDIYGNITGFMGSFKMMIQDAAGKLVEVIRDMMDVFFVTK